MNCQQFELGQLGSQELLDQWALRAWLPGLGETNGLYAEVQLAECLAGGALPGTEAGNKPGVAICVFQMGSRMIPSTWELKELWPI